MYGKLCYALFIACYVIHIIKFYILPVRERKRFDTITKFMNMFLKVSN